METHTQILNIPICREVGYTPITRAKISELPSGRTNNERYSLYKAKLKDFRNSYPEFVTGYYDHNDDSFYQIELVTSITIDEDRELHIRELSSSSHSGLDWCASIYDKGVRVLYVQSQYAELRMTDPFTDSVFAIQNGVLLSQEIGEFVQFNKASPGTDPAFFKGASPSDALGYKIYVYNTAPCAPVYFDEGVLSARDKEEAVEYIDSMVNNLLAAKRSILETNIISNAAVEEYCKSFANLINPEDVIFKGF